jgi:serine protease Do
VILAVDGVPVTSPEELADAIRTHAVGEKVPLMVLGGGKYRQVTVLLRAAPDPKAAPSAAPAHPAELSPAAEQGPRTRSPAEQGPRTRSPAGDARRRPPAALPK